MRLAVFRAFPPLVATLLLAGCSGGGGGSSASSTERLSHVWQFQSGALFEPYTYYAGEVTWLVLREDGTGELFSRRNVSGATGCTTLLFQVLDGDVLQIEIPALSQTDAAFAGKGGGGASWLLAWDIAGGELTVTDPQGGDTVFARASEDEVPAADRCEAPLALVDVALPLEPLESNPVFGTDGTRLWYATSYEFGYVQTGFDPANGGPLGSVTIDLRELHAWQGADVWAGTGAGHNQSVLRLVPPSYSDFTAADTVDTLYDLFNEVSMGSALIDSAGHLWMGGQEIDEDRDHVVVIDVSGEPDVVLSDVTVDTRLYAIAHRNGELWALQRTLGSMLVQLDPVTGAVLRNVELPENDYWSTLASAGGELYVHAYDYTVDQHHFVRVSL